MPHFGEKKQSLFVPYNDKIADITHPDTNKHFLDLEAALTETRKIIAVVLYGKRIGAGKFRVYPNEGTERIEFDQYEYAENVIIADGTQRLQYSLTIAGDDWDLYCLGYVVEV